MVHDQHYHLFFCRYDHVKSQNLILLQLTNHFSYVKEGLVLGQLMGNRFTITLRYCFFCLIVYGNN